MKNVCYWGWGLFILILNIGCGSHDPGVNGSGSTEAVEAGVEPSDEESESETGCTKTDGICEEDARVFVTSSTSSGNLGGLAGADATCDSLAMAAGLSRTYVALLSDSDTDAKDRVTTEGMIYNFSDSDTAVLVANSEADLWDADTTNLSVPVQYTDGYTQISGLVWTGTEVDGTMSASHCNGWTNGSMLSGAQLGDSAQVDSGWIADSGRFCANNRRFYCIGQ